MPATPAQIRFTGIRTHWFLPGLTVLYWNDGLFLKSPRLAIDVARRQSCGFVSHAHKDHAAKHAWTIATPETHLLLRARKLQGDRETSLPFGDEYQLQDLNIQLLPAGHMLGAAMLKLSGPAVSDLTILYTGDFRLRSSELIRGAQPEPADILIMETTFGQPLYQFPDREKQADQLANTVRRTLERGQLPVLYAYEVGKSQEIIQMLTSREIPVRAHPDIAAMCEVYRECGADPGPLLPWEAQQNQQTQRDADEPAAIITSPHKRAMPHFPASKSQGNRSPRRVKIAVTGWAAKPGFARAKGFDYAFVISDHADYNELVELVELVQPETVLCTHGNDTFMKDLIYRGMDARRLERGFQLAVSTK